MFAKYIEIWPMKNTFSVLSYLYLKIQKYFRAVTDFKSCLIPLETCITLI